METPDRRRTRNVLEDKGSSAACRRGGLPVGRLFLQLFHHACDGLAFVLQEIGDRAPQSLMGDVMRGIGRTGKVAAQKLVTALRARLHAREPLFDGEVDSLVIAGLEVKERNVADATPVAAIKRFAVEEIERASDIAPIEAPTRLKNSRVR